MSRFFNDIATLFVQYLDIKARQYTTDALHETRRIVYGLVFFAVAVVFWTVGLIFLFTAVFFALSPWRVAAPPAAWTGLIALATGMVVALGGMRFYRKRAVRSRRLGSDGGL
jgi:VIT1/CCC1 family predicted Fe2+/Mn2+ transporter